MSLSVVLSHTPVWVWLLLALVLWRGASALQPREAQARRVLLVPLIFLLWGVSGLLGSRGLGLDFVLFVGGLIVGLLGGAALAMLSPAPEMSARPGFLRMPGSWVPLALILIAFPIKYALAVATATADSDSDAAFYLSLGAGIGGVFAGLFWGRTLMLFRRALLAAGRGADFGAIVALAGSGQPNPRMS